MAYYTRLIQYAPRSLTTSGILKASATFQFTRARNYASAAAPHGLNWKKSLQVMPDNLEDKVIAVTGAASGMGLALAKLLVQRGAQVSIADVTETGLEKARVQLEQLSNGSQIVTQKVDVTKADEVHSWIDRTVSTFGRLDGAANVAGVIDVPSPANALFHQDQAEKGWDWVIGINLTGVANCMRAELRHMKDGGSIVNFTSVAGLRSVGTTIAYTASKHGVVGLTRAAASQYGPQGIRINAVAPGVVQTPMLAGREQSHGSSEIAGLLASTPLRRKADPEEIGKVAMFLLSDDASYVTGSVYSADAGMF